MTYCYRKPDGEIVELSMSVAEKERRERHDGMLILDDGTIVVRDYQAERCGVTPPGNWPQISRAMGVGSSQVAEAVAEDRKRGVSSEYDSRGNKVFRSRSDRRDWCRAYGVKDRDGGYSDPT